ncbi:MAG: type II and III secretion system protein, partial [Kiritimatiellia bacterium]
LKRVRTAILSVDDVSLMLSALKQTDGASVVSNPKIVVANEESAIIHIGETERPFISTVTPGSDNAAPIVTYNPGDPVDLGVKVMVTPTINTEKSITIRIEPELTRRLEDAVAPNGQTYPIISTKKIQTIFSLESGKTAAIGGLTETTDIESEKKVPLLGDIPLIGKYLFTYSHKEKDQRETIIFVTVGLCNPDVIENKTGVPDDSRLIDKYLLKHRQEKIEHTEDIRLLEEAQRQSLENPQPEKKKGLMSRWFGR